MSLNSFVNTTGSNNSMLFSNNKIPNASNSCGGQCTSYQNGGGYGFSADQSIPGFRLPEVKSYLNVGVNSDTNLAASKQFIPNNISGGRRNRNRHRRRTHRMKYLQGGANDIFYGFTGIDSSSPAFRGSYPQMTLGNNASVGSVGGRKRRYKNLAKSKRMRYMGGNMQNYDNKNTFYGFNGENRNDISLFKGSYSPVAVGDNDIFSVGGKKHRRHNKSKGSKRKNNNTRNRTRKHRKHRVKQMKMMPMQMSMPMAPMANMPMQPMQMSMMPMQKTKKNMRSNLFKSLIGGRHKY